MLGAPLCDGGLYGEMLMNRSFEERVMPEGYHVENALYPPPWKAGNSCGSRTIRPASAWLKRDTELDHKI